MPKLQFTRNDAPTIGVEVELQLIDAETLALSNSIEPVLDGLPAELSETIKPELMQCYLEINTGVCRTVRDVGQDLCEKLDVLEQVTDSLGLRLFWG
ncbi:MAG: glutamate-cysteine ligase family protein, partial [Planctomycetaceae bacterium]